MAAGSREPSCGQGCQEILAQPGESSSLPMLSARGGVQQAVRTDLLALAQPHQRNAKLLKPLNGLGGEDNDELVVKVSPSRSG